MKVAQIRLDTQRDADELSADIDGFRLWYRTSSSSMLRRSADCFLAAGLLAAMVRREPLELAPGESVSPRLLSGMDELQTVFTTWRHELARVPVLAAATPAATPTRGVASFFSGGVDSLYTYLERQAEITHLIQIHGFEYRRQNRELAAQAEAANRRFIASRSCQLVVVESNFREFYESHGIHIFLYHGGILASIAMALGFERAYVPASVTWDKLYPWGSHPVTDALWSTDSVDIVHHGAAARRLDKLRRLVVEPDALALLRVCPTNTVYSCGLCEKCLRTRVLMRVLGVSSPHLLPLRQLGPVRGLRLGHSVLRAIWQENLEAAVQVGDSELARAISFPIASYDARQALRSMERALVGGRLRRAVRALRRLTGRTAPQQVAPLRPEQPDIELQ